jgi:hypothetical protein
MRMRVKLPVIYCPGCRTQLVNHIYYDLKKHDLLCIWCAKRRPKGTVAAINGKEAGFVAGEAPALNQVDAIALLVRRGARLQ